MEIEKIVQQISMDARMAAREVAKRSSVEKDAALSGIARMLLEQKEMIQEENKKDLEAAREKGLSPAMIDRLTISDRVIDSMVQGINDIIKLEDPVGSQERTWIRPNGLAVSRMRIPLGVIGIIYESRPNVTVDAAVLCIKSGNAVILRGGSEAFHSNRVLARIIAAALSENGFPEKAVQVVPVREREAVLHLLAQEEYVDLIIPRGGEGLIRFVTENSRIPVLKHYKGVCHVYVDKGADLGMAYDICFNSKVQRPGVCNAMETLLVHEDIAPAFLPQMAKRFQDAGVVLRGCPETLKLGIDAEPATEEDWPAEYLDLVLAVRIVPDMDEAMAHIAKYGSMHTEAIVTSDYARAERFLREVESSVVLVNASTRFNDGGQLGLGAEMGISTSKLHAFGPMGLKELTTTKFIVRGSGQVRT